MNITWYVYILSNVSRTLYIGITNELERRIGEHRLKLQKSFSREYNVTLLVYVESFGGPQDAIAREKQLKGWVRAKKVALIERENPDWLDLSAAWR